MRGLILTHPHNDHAPGLDQLITEFPDAWIGCAPGWVLDWPKIDLQDAQSVQSSGSRIHALAAVHNSWTNRPETKWEIERGSQRHVGEATLTVLHPGANERLAFKRRPQVDPNLISSPVLMEWKDCRLLLGADLPKSRWRRFDPGLDLGRHSLLKIPHHTSQNGIHDSFSVGADERYWFATPYNRNAGLPNFSHGNGIWRYLQRATKLTLTSLPYRLNQNGQDISREVIEQAATPKLTGLRISLPLASAERPCRGWVAVSICGRGTVVAERLGPLARRIVRP
ncbi:hypothetical protein IV102_35610 [bacterium]|nr:hypothetical protein [bacterium]